MSDPPQLVLIRGVVYKLLNRSNLPISKPNWKYVRQSVPPDAEPGRRSKWPHAYTIRRLPTHEAIDEESARAVKDAAMVRWRAALQGSSQ